MSSTATCPRGLQDDPHAYWQAADEHERANGRLYSEVQFALPRELDAGGRRELAGAFAEQVCGGERLPYTLALHRGGQDGGNPHAHLMFSERGNDGIARSAEQWFKRHNPKAPAQGGARKSRAAKAGDWLDKTRQAWEQTANRALEQAGRAERIDGRSIADRRDAAHHEGDLERAAELSREPNVHRGPGQYLDKRGRASATVAQEARVKQRTAAALAERDADRRQVERLEREIAGVGARLKETYDRVRRALDSTSTASWPSNTRRSRSSCPRRSRAWESRCGSWPPSSTRRSRRNTSRMDRRVGRTCHDLDRRLRLAFGERQQNDRRLQQCYEGVERTFSMIHPEAEQKRKDGDRPDRVEGLIESRIQNRMRSRGHDIDL